MIINHLIDYYDLLAQEENHDIPRLHYEKTSVSFAIVLSESGELLGLEDLRTKSEYKGKLIPKSMLLPETPTKTSGISANFLSGNPEYIFGIATGKNPERSKKTFISYRDFHLDLLKGIDCDESRAVTNYLEKWNTTEAAEHLVIKDNFEALKGALLIFRLDGKEHFIHENVEIKKCWEKHKANNASQYLAQSLITGNVEPIARLHQKIKRIEGAQTSGASIVSFNTDAFESYGKSQSYNSPIDETSTFKYTTVLNYLLTDRRNKITIGDTTLAFWAERQDINGDEESVFREFLLNDGIESLEDGEDLQTGYIIRKIMERVKRGEKITDEIGSHDDTRFFILGFSPNGGRISLRFFFQNMFGSTIAHMAQHYLDLEIYCSEKQKKVLSISDILRELSPNQDLKKISPLLAGQLTRCILDGKYYGDGPFIQMLNRIKMSNNKVANDVNEVQASFIKACLIRRREDNNRKGDITVGLSEENKNNGYLLGRLFAVLEKSQRDVSKNLNKTIKDTYFGSAMTTPSTIFPILIRLGQHHIEKSDYGFIRDKEIGAILSEVNGFPANLNLSDQGQFVLGYYHQRENYKPKEVKNTEEVLV